MLRAYVTLHTHTHCVPDGDTDHDVVLTGDFVEGGPARRAWTAARSRVQLSDKVQGYIRFDDHRNVASGHTVCRRQTRCNRPGQHVGRNISSHAPNSHRHGRCAASFPITNNIQNAYRTRAHLGFRLFSKRRFACAKQRGGGGGGWSATAPAHAIVSARRMAGANRHQSTSRTGTWRMST